MLNRKMWILSVVLPGILAISLGSYGPVMAQAPAPEHLYRQLVQEAFQAHLVYPEEEGEVQFSYRPAFLKGNGTKTVENALALEYGFSEAWQVEIECDFFDSIRSSGDLRMNGMGDSSVGAQYSFMNMSGSDFHLALGAEVGLPTGDVTKELGEGFVSYNPYIAAAQDLPTLNNAQIFTDFGVEFVHRVKNHDDREENEPSAHELSWDVGTISPVNQVLRLIFELNWRNNRWNRNGDLNELYVTSGVAAILQKDWEIGLGVPVGLTNTSDDWRMIAQVIYEFEH